MKIRVLTTCALACLAALPAMPGAARTQPPSYGGYAVAAGLEQIAKYIEGLHFTESDIEYLRSRNIFSDDFHG